MCDNTFDYKPEDCIDVLPNDYSDNLYLSSNKSNECVDELVENNSENQQADHNFENLYCEETQFATNNYCKNKCEFFVCCYANYDYCIKKTMNEIIDTFTPREKRVLQLCFGGNCDIQNYDSLSKELDVSEERVKQIAERTLRKLRHPYRSKKIEKYIFDISLCAPDSFYSHLINAIFDNPCENDLGIQLGLDFSIINTKQKSQMTPSEINDELNTSVFDFEEFSPFTDVFNDLKISTLNHLLHTPTEKLFSSFNNDVLYFDLFKTVSKLGYSFKNDLLNNHVKEILYNNLFSIIYNEDALQKTVMDLSLSTTIKLLDNEIKTLGELSEKFHIYNQEACFTTEEQQQISSLLLKKGLLLIRNDTCEIINFTESRLKEYLNRLIDWLIINRLSIIDLIDSLDERKIYWLYAIEYINKRYPDFVGSINCDYIL